MTKKLVSEIIQLIIAVVLASIGLKAFLLPNGFLDGGATGIAILIAKATSVELSWALPVVSIPFFIIGWVTISKRILIKSILSIVALSLVIHFENFTSITEDKLIIATFGGIFLGAGIGLAIRNGAVLDGSELLGIYLHEKLGLSIGSIILGFNIILFAITALVLSPEIAMYSTLTYFITGKAIDFTLQGFENYVGLMIISEKSNSIFQEIKTELGSGITVYQGIKGSGKTGDKNTSEIIHIIINRIDRKRVQNIIDEIDTEAFTVEFDVNHVKGGKIRKLSLRKSNA